VPEEAPARAWAAGNGHEGDAALADLCADTAFHAHMAEVVKRVNDGLSPIERVRRFILTADPFTVDNGQMTPTMKLRRHVLKEKYGERLEALYH
jgi:long-chain acyl-CoA synthetase